MPGESADATIYTPLPAALGGRPDAAPGPLADALPGAGGRALPGAEELEGRVRHRALQLHSDAPAKRTRKRAARRGRAGKLVIPRAEQKYALYEPLAALWRAYAGGVAASGGTGALGERVVRMDLHGAPVEVARARDPGLVGVRGILVAETANTVLVVTRADRALTLPKAAAVLRFAVGPHVVELMLPALAFRASERSARKLKKARAGMLL